MQVRNLLRIFDQNTPTVPTLALHRNGDRPPTAKIKAPPPPHRPRNDHKLSIHLMKPDHDGVGTAGLATGKVEQCKASAKQTMQRRAEQHLYQRVDDSSQQLGGLELFDR